MVISDLSSPWYVNICLNYFKIINNDRIAGCIVLISCAKTYHSVSFHLISHLFSDSMMKKRVWSIILYIVPFSKIVWCCYVLLSFFFLFFIDGNSNWIAKQVMTDPDVPNPSDPFLKERLHWYVQILVVSFSAHISVICISFELLITISTLFFYKLELSWS